MNQEPITKARSLWAEAWQRVRRRRFAMFCLAVIVAYFTLGVLDFIPVTRRAGGSESAPQVKGTFVDWAFARIVGEPDRNESYVPPGTGRHLMGTDIHGVDVLYKTVKGIGTAFRLGGMTAAIYIPLGLLFGIMAGYFGGWLDDFVVYVYSTLACIPGILMLIALMTVMERGIVQLSIALGVTGWVGLCRLVRGETLKRREAEYVLAARALGASHGRVVFRHILPNLFHIVIITFTLGFSNIILSEAVLSYIGIGVKPETISWGRMIEGARMELSREPSVWWQLGSAGAALFGLVLAFNMFGDALRDALDPRLRTGKEAA